MPTNKQLYAELNKILKEVRAKLVEAEKFAETNQLEFSFGITNNIDMAQYYPHSDKVRPCTATTELGDNLMVVGDDEENKPKIKPLKKHRTDVCFSEYQGYHDEPPFQGGWWIPSRMC